MALKLQDDHGMGKINNEEFNEMYCSPNIFRVIKSNEMGLAGHVAPMVERTGVYSFFVGNPKCKRLLARPSRRSTTWDR